MGISGRVAEASRLGLEDLLERKLLEEKLNEQRQQQAIINARAERELGMRDREQTFRESESVANRSDREAERAIRDADRARVLDAEAGQKRTLGNMAGVIEMVGSGMDAETARREIAMTGLRGGVEPPRMLEGLLPVAKEPKRHVVTTPGPGGRPLRRLVDEDELIKGVPEYRAPKEPRAPSGQLSQRDIANAMRMARRDAMTAYRTAAGPTGRVTDEAGNVVELDDYIDQYVDDYLSELEQVMGDDRSAPTPGVPSPTAPSARPPASTAPPAGARPLQRGSLRRRDGASPSQNAPKVGDVVTLRDGTRVRVTGFDASGKVQGARVP